MSSTKIDYEKFNTTNKTNTVFHFFINFNLFQNLLDKFDQ